MSIPTSPEEIERLKLIGFRALTYPYILPNEEEEFERCRAQLVKGNVPYATIYYTDTEVEIWTVHNPEEEGGAPAPVEAASP